MTGIGALQWAKELSKLPNGCFTIAFFPYSRQKGESSEKLVVRAVLSGHNFRKNDSALIVRTSSSLMMGMVTQRCVIAYLFVTWDFLKMDINCIK
jgi:hypothetical protein